jgi:hypothetical protein
VPPLSQPPSQGGEVAPLLLGAEQEVQHRTVVPERVPAPCREGGNVGDDPRDPLGHRSQAAPRLRECGGREIQHADIRVASGE